MPASWTSTRSPCRFPKGEKGGLRHDSFQRLFGLDHDDTAEAAYDLADLYAAEDRKLEAVVLLTSAIDHGLPSQSDLELASDPMLRSLKGDPAFEVVLADARRYAATSQAAK